MIAPKTLCCALLLLSGIACETEPPARAPKSSSDESPSQPPASPPPPPPKAPLLKRGREIMSTWFQLSLAGAERQPGIRALDAALDEIERLEGVLSEWKPQSQISRLNRAAGTGAWTELGPESLAVLQAGLRVSRWSEGAYDLSWAALRGLYRFDGSRKVPPDAEIAARLPQVGYEGIELSREPPRARLERKGMAVGTGGIAKGYALDRAAKRLEEAGFENYLLFAGGQVQVHGSRGGRPWRVGIQHPRKARDYIGYVELHQGSVSTSGDYEHFFIADGTRWHHILDLATGKPARRSVSVTLIAPRGVYADALSTACFVLGAKGCFELLEQLPFSAEAVVIDPELHVHVSPGLEGKVVFTPPLVDRALPPS